VRGAAGALTAALALGGCGGTTATSGRAIFDRACAHCHTLTGHDTSADGGDLGLGTLTVAQIASFARVMPVHPALTAPQIGVVARYVAHANHD
jgi:mono/diheme cytochrome c family protein